MKVLFFVLTLVSPNTLLAVQDSTWFRYDLVYYKISTAKEGIYRIGYEALANTGMPMQQINPKFFRLYHRGKEVALHVDGEEDSRFDTVDFIDFLGLKNDATLDLLLLEDGLSISNPFVNTFSDTTAFFLTYTAGELGKRMEYLPSPVHRFAMATYYLHEIVHLGSEQYALGRMYDLGVRRSIFDQGEGWTGPVISTSYRRVFELSTEISYDAPCTLSLGGVGRSPRKHTLSLWVGPSRDHLSLLDTLVFFGYAPFFYSADLGKENFSMQGDLHVELRLEQQHEADYFSVSFLQLRYPKGLPLGDAPAVPILLPAKVQEVILSSDSRNFLVYQGENPYEMQQHQLVQEADSLRFLVGVAKKTSKLWMVCPEQTLEVRKLQPVQFRDMLAPSANYLLLGHPFLEKPSSIHSNPLKAYAAYRASPQGGDFDTLIVDIEDLYNHFTFGEKTPLAVHLFLRDYWQKHRPSHLFLVGRSLAPFSQPAVTTGSIFAKNHPEAFDFQDLVPPAGFPYSDKYYVMGVDSTRANIPVMAVGRLPVTRPQQISDYLLKVMQKESQGVRLGEKPKILHLSGGFTPLEGERYQSYLSEIAFCLAQSGSVGEVFAMKKTSLNEVEPLAIPDEIQESLDLLTFFGHGSSDYLELDLGFVKDSLQGRDFFESHPIFLILSCSYGSAFSSKITKAEDWLLTPRGWASAVISPSAFAIDVVLKRYTSIWYEVMFSNWARDSCPTLGEVILQSDALFLERYGMDDLNLAQVEQMLLLGDPALRAIPSCKLP
jgi:hypothetical protein